MPKAATAKGKIINGYVRMWPRGVFARGEEKRMLARSLDFLKGPGVYVLYRDDVPYYIGQATSLQKRLFIHARRPDRRYFHFWNFFSAFAVREKNLRNELEGILIASMPTANSTKPRLRREPMPPSDELPPTVRLTVRRGLMVVLGLLGATDRLLVRAALAIKLKAVTS